jgi:hypothetical protein
VLFGDLGGTGARATAETLDQPLELMAKMRREVHEELLRDIAGYVIDAAVIAPRGPLRGTVAKDGDRLVVTLPEGDDRNVEVDWPDFDSTPVKDRVAAISEAAGVQTSSGSPVLPPLLTFKLLATALGVDDIDELVDKLTDDDGQWIDPEVTAAAAAIEAHRRGQDPADQL